MLRDETDGERRRVRRAWAAPAVLILAAVIASPRAEGQQTIVDAAGRRIGTLVSGEGAPAMGRGPARLAGGVAFNGPQAVRFGAGQYAIMDPGGFPSPGGTAEHAFVDLFKDGTLEYLPLKEWDLGDIETGDLDGDGRDDIVFSLKRNNCDSIPGTRPRVWIQNSDRRFVDETDARIPALSASTYDLDLFDADGDGDLDILACGFSCLPDISTGTLLINDGSGVFTDETAEKLIGVPEFTFLSYAAEARIDTGESMDIVAILTDTRQGITYPYLFLNSGDGHFWPDVYGRLAGYRPYGFFDVAAADLTGDGRNDLLFLNIAYPEEGVAGGTALFRNAGNGFFVDETASRIGPDTLRSSRDAEFGDADGDGDTDIIEVGWFFSANVPQVRLLLNDGTGSYAPAPAGALDSLSDWYNDVGFAPFVQDSLPDIFLAKIVVLNNSADVLLVNAGGGTFRDSSELLPSGLDWTTAVSVFDYDRDGDYDIAVGNGSPIVDQPGQNRLYINLRRSPAVGVGDIPVRPAAAALIGNYPNPFNPSTTIRYSLPDAAEVTLIVTSALGRMVTRLECGRQAPGTHELRWDAGALPAGVYWYSLHADGRRISTRAAQLVR